MQRLSVRTYCLSLLFTAAAFCSPAQATQYIYDLHNRPNENFGMLLFFGEDALEDRYDVEFDQLAVRFDFNDPSSSATLVYDDVTNTVQISGAIRGYYDPSRSDSVDIDDDDEFSTNWVNTVWNLNLTYRVNVSADVAASSITVQADAANNGTLSPVDGPLAGLHLALRDKNGPGYSLTFGPNGELLLGNGWFGFWVPGGGDGSGDFWFSASRRQESEIPEPASLALLGLALTPAIAQRRRNRCK